MNKNQKFTTSLGIMTCACALLAASSSQAAEYQVTVNTTSLIGNVNAPYYVDFQLNSGGGPFNNMATVNNFNFGGGSPSPVGSAMVYAGNPTGDLSTGFTLVDVPGAASTSAFNEISQQFTAGSTLSFDVTLTDNGGTPSAGRVLNLPLMTVLLANSDNQSGWDFAGGDRYKSCLLQPRDFNGCLFPDGSPICGDDGKHNPPSRTFLWGCSDWKPG